MNKNILVAIFITILIVAPLISAAPYDTYTDNSCDNIICSMSISSNPKNVFEDGIWKPYREARSLKDKIGFKINFLEVDDNYPLEVLDFNATSIKLDLKHWSLFNNQVDLKIWKYKDENSSVLDFKNTYKKKVDEQENFNIFDLGSKAVVYDFEFGDIIEFGANSTLVMLNMTPSVTFKNVFDSGDDHTCQSRWNISAIPKFAEIIATEFGGLVEMIADPQLNVTFYRLPNQTWTSGTYDLDDFNDETVTLTNTTITNWSAIAVVGQWVYSSINDIIKQDFALGNNFSTIRAESTSFPTGGADTVSSNRYVGSTSGGGNYLRFSVLHLNITYSLPVTPTITFPLNENYLNMSQINWSISDPFQIIDACWYSFNGGINTTVTCSDNTTIVSLNPSTYNLSFFVNDTYGAETYTTVLFGNGYKINLTSFNTSTYETKTETFVLNISSDGTYVITANLSYNGTIYPSTKYGNNNEMRFVNTITNAENEIGNHSFFWNVSVDEFYVNTPTYYQDVQQLNFSQCNGGSPFINFTFLDEGNSSSLNASIEFTDWTYWLSTASVNKSLTYKNISELRSYEFCLNANETLHNTGTIRYESTGYPQRKHFRDTDLTNATTHQPLYLLGSFDGLYVVFQVMNELGDTQPGSQITVERQFSGVWTTIGIDTTDSAGTATFWLNPNYDHRVTVTNPDCATTTQTVRPTQSAYTISLVCGVSGAIYVSPIDGIKWSRLPADGIIENKEYNFTFQVTSSKDNIQAAMFHVVLANGTRVINVSGDCAPGGCILSSMYTALTDADMKGKYYIDIGNGFILVEADARWRTVNITTSGSGTFTFFNDLKFALDNWGDNENTKDFNRLVVIFFILCILISAANYFTGFDSANPGSFLAFLTAIVFGGSVSDGINGQGLFYFNNFTGNSWINNYILLVLMIVITVGLFIRTNRRRGG